MADRMFGTNGVRGVINEDMTSTLALQMGKAIGTVFKGNVAIATDTRVSADMIKTAVSSGMMSVGTCIIDLGMLPTPAIQYYVKKHASIMGGVMITASHNPSQFNGIKCIASDGTEASREQEMEVEAAYAKELPCVSWEKVGKVQKVNGAGEEYIDAVISNIDADAIRNANFKVCLDCANGAAVQTSPLLLKKLNVRTITINGNAQGEFPGHPSEPTEENLKDLIFMTKATGSDLGIAHDGDADRCVFVSSDGKFVSGDKSLALLAKYILSTKKGIVITPVSSSSLVEEIVKQEGGELIYTAVGSPIVARKMIENGAVFGGEENGGLIFPEQQYCRDAAMSIVKMLECIVKNGSLSTQISKLPVYYTYNKKIYCPDNAKSHVLDFLERISTEGTVDKTDGIKIIFKDGWVLARPSGTEPIFRIYSESKEEDVAKARADEYEAKVMDFLDPDGIHRQPKTSEER
ncbi:MAG: phosphoglucosamine mutase [Candidatus Methanomethylophilaceae archaeon]|nr:phosphoglucosamine mutase [Candidatus Methanomethylophilaceae archaeon]MDD3378406.1 phosphoglucosamine mutase [Candidatus Methanomethylophilaceae archaeon]MDY0224005.1 phosphoglucosamine mutase [Candidatus Methanomethylophilaceae archaeon]